MISLPGSVNKKDWFYLKWTLDQRLSLIGVIDAYLIARLYHFVMVEGLGMTRSFASR